VTGPFVVVDCACYPIRQPCAPDERGVLLFARTPLEAGRFETREEAAEAIRSTCEVRGWVVKTYQVLTLAEWEEEQLAPARRGKKKAAEEVES
jgi:hypothetical protein